MSKAKTKTIKILQLTTLATFTAILFNLTTIPAVFAAGSAQWSPTADGITIANEGVAIDQDLQQIVATSDSNYIIAWRDKRSDADGDIYAQKINSSGAFQWTATGVAISTATNQQPISTESIAITADNNGGAIIAWGDRRSGTQNDLYAQKIDSYGTVQWTADGIQIDTNSSEPVVLSDNAGGAFIVYTNTSGANKDLYATHIGSDGNVAPDWNTGGAGTFKPLNISTGHSTTDEYNQQIISDDSNGFIIAYETDTAGEYHIYAVRISSTGAKDANWTPFVEVSASNGIAEQNPAIAGDGVNGAIIAYNKDGVLYAQQVGYDGVVLWSAGGEQICSTAGITNHGIVYDNQLGAIITWEDPRLGGTNDIYAQRVDDAGTGLWTANGIAISNTSDGLTQSSPKIISNGGYGAIITYTSEETGSRADILVQHINSSGTAQYTANGIYVEDNTTNRIDANPVLAPDNDGGAVIAWNRIADGETTKDIFAQYIQDDIGGLCTETASGTFCGKLQIRNEILTLSNTPDSFNFTGITAGANSDNFNNAEGVAISDQVKVYDSRESGGFILTVDNNGSFSSGVNTIPINNLFVVTTADNPAPPGAVTLNGITYDDSIPVGDRTISAPIDATSQNLGSSTTFTSLAPSSQFGISPIVLMDATMTSAEGRNGSVWQYLSYYLFVPALQESGNYAVIVTYTLTDSTTP